MRSAAATMMLLHKRGAPALLLPEFLKEVYVGQRTGLLHVTLDERTGVTFRSVNGEIVSGSSSAERGRLGEHMVQRGLISRADLERALVIVVRQKRRLAPVLRELDLVDTPRLERALAFHIRALLLTALRWQESALLFEDQELPDAPAEDLTLRCSTAELIFGVVRQIPEPGTVRRALGSLERPFVVAADPSSRVDHTLIGPAERHLIAHADGKASARSVIDGARLTAEDLERSLLALLCTGVLRFETATPVRTGPSSVAAVPEDAGSRAR